jgi:hypothetical protein
MLLEEWETLKFGTDDTDKPESLSEWLKCSPENIRHELDKMAYEAHRDQPTLKGTADIHVDKVTAALRAASRDRLDARFLRLEEYLRDRAGLLV